MNDIPDFLNRNLKDTAMTHAPSPAPTPKKKRRTDALIVRVTISVPLNMSDADSLYKATNAIDGLASTLPEGTKIDFASKGLGKMPG